MTRLDAAGVLFTHPGNLSVLLVKPFYKPYWDLPGGKVEDGEFEAQAARREVAEELGLNIPHPSTAWVSAAFRTRVGVRTVGAQA